MNFFSELLGTLKPQTPRKVDESVLRQRQLTPKVTATRIPFAKSPPSEEYYPDQGILEALNEIDFTEDQFRNSTELKLLLNEIVSSISLFHCWGKQSVKVRLNAFVKLLVSQLCIPQLMSLYGVGSSILSSGSDASNVTFISKAKNVLIEAFSLFKLSEELLLNRGDDSSLDHRRFHLFIVLVEFKCSPFLAHGMTVREFGGVALEALSCHILSVSAVTASVLESIKIVISRMTNVLSCETANYTIQECLPTLEELVVDYFRWLRQNFDFLVRLSRKEEIITSVDTSTRAWLRAETYSSPVEILSVYNQKYREKLTHMSIPLQPYKRRDIEQAKKDLVRERILLNHVEYHGGYSVLLNDAHDQSSVAHVQKELCGMVKSELRKVMSYLFEIESFQVDVDNLLNGDAEGNGDTDKESAASSFETVLSVDVKHSIAVNMSASRAASRDRSSNSSSSSQSRSSSRDNAGRSPYHLNKLLNEAITSPAQSPQQRVRKVSSSGSLSGDSGASDSESRPRLRSRDLQDSPFWEFDLLDALFAYTILAASRTFAGGDAFLILNDLYGGEGLTLCPCKAPRMVIRTSPTGTPGTPKREFQQVVKKLSDTTIAITAAGVKVTLRERYSLYASAEMNNCSNPDALKPLMRFECTTATLLILRNPSQGASIDSSSEKREACARLFQTLVSNPEQVCHRAVTIEPYL